MNAYTPPVSGLLKLGRPEFPHGEIDYLALGFTAEHVPQLVRLVQDDELAFGDSDGPEVYAQIHAWRALAQLRAPEAIEPLFDLIEQQDEDDWSDWVTEEVPVILGGFGPVVIAPVVARLDRRGQQVYAPCDFANVLVEVARQFPETRAEVVGHLTAVLSTATANHPSLNGFIVSDLIDTKAVEAWPAIEAAFATGNVDESIAGDAADVKYRLGLGPEPPRRVWNPALPPSSPGSRSGTSAKQRHDERKRKERAEKKKNKKKRKR